MNEKNSFNDNALDAELERELRQMFALDSREYLQNYLNLAENLNSKTWQEDIKEMYRAIHTIKGNAVTVGANAVLQVAIALEDLLSELRYQEEIALEDGKLQKILLEVGELTVSSLEVKAVGDKAKKIVEPTVKRIYKLKTEIEQQYLPNWNEETLLQQEFAEQGFDLVVLDLEMAVEELKPDSTIPPETIETVKSTLEQLTMIGQELHLGEGWIKLLNQGETLLENKDSQEWIKQYPTLLAQLKQSAKKGGVITPPTTTPKPIQLTEGSINKNTAVEIPLNLTDQQKQKNKKSTLHPDEKETLIDENAFLQAKKTNTVRIDKETFTDVEFVEDLSGEDEEDFNLDVLDNLNLILDPETDLDLLPELDLDDQSIREDTVPTAIRNKIVEDKVREETTTDTHIPVPLTRIQETADNLVHVLLSTRTVSSFYSSLQSQLTKLLSIAGDNNQYVTKLRQLQNDYALMGANQENNITRMGGVQVEGYRSGYTTINSLLENSLRLSEIGAEANKLANTVADTLQSLELSLLNLQKSVDSSRLVSFKNLSFRARAIIRDLSNRYDKSVRLLIEGENIDLDAGVSSKLEPILLHLLRNSFDHGLENSEERLAKGKPSQGTIQLSLKRLGNQYLLQIQDDGRGIDPQKIKSIAQSKKLPLTKTNSPSEILAVICQSGFTSTSVVTDISGRGVGMDVVSEQVKNLGGTLSLDTVLNQGTTFTILIPVPNLFVPCVLLKCGDILFAIPREEIITTLLWSDIQNKTQDSDSVILQTEHGKHQALYILEYWHRDKLTRGDLTPLNFGDLSDTAVCVMIKGSNPDQKIWLIADELQGQMELLLEPLPNPLIAPIGLLGLSLDVDGSLIPVLSGIQIVDYLKSFYYDSVTTLTEATVSPSTPEVTESNTILVVDDAALMRRRLEASLDAYGYEVYTCGDGLEAWNWLQANPLPAMIITDIEMPNMDGFTLIDTCRNAGITIPILVVSSRLSEDWGQEAFRVGANDYLTKGFSTADLINKVQSLISS
jgi:chemotaxis protein histidine kinase CheA/CheY-like chemotaxis protein